MTTFLAPSPAPSMHLPQEQRQAGDPPSCTGCRCEHCCVGTLCLPGGLTDEDLRPLASLSLATRRFARGEAIHASGDRFRSIYAIRSGACKTTLLGSDGREQVVGFHLAGDVIGMDGIAEGVHATTATALEDVQVCLIEHARLVRATASHPHAKDLLAHLLSRQIVNDHGMLVMLGLTDARQRLAAFLLDVSQRHAVRGWSPREFRLPMSRTEIASFLGVKPETVSRTLTLFQDEGLVARCGRRIRITDLAGLRRQYDVRSAHDLRVV